ncbi:hypothetical protein [Neobacillus jeddahensis]|uniref:hypothetical protein n=1 Tax=Neobacillus jeddahensis TaxID=1461580 RepID=UPI00058CD2C9|nr:hypothetical protein [Neobacillus jeddahensis]
MIQILVFILTIIALVLLSIFTVGLMELYKLEKEVRNNLVREGMLGYLDEIFGMGAAKIFKTILDAEGNHRYLVYLPQYAWFKSPKYQWFEVYETDNGFVHSEVAGY